MIVEILTLVEQVWSEPERRRVVRLCARLTGDVAAADDLAQETLLQSRVPPAYGGRVFGSLQATIWLLSLLSLLVAVVGEWVPGRSVCCPCWTSRPASSPPQASSCWSSSRPARTNLPFVSISR